MATLTQATQSTRTILRWIGIILGAFIIFRYMLLPIGIGLYNHIFPKTPPAPTMTFGKLPKIPFPQTPTLANLSFSIKTTTGTLPASLPDRLNVYKISKDQASFTSYDRAKRKVEAVGFKAEGIALTPIIYQWKYQENEARVITFNIVTQSFMITTIQTSSSSEPPPSVPESITIAKNLLSNMSLLPKDIDDSHTQSTFLKISGSSIVNSTSLSESDFVQVDFYRKPINDLPIMYPDTTHSLMSFRIKKASNDNFDVDGANYSYKLVNTNTFSTYPIKTAQVAYDELQAGKGYITPASLISLSASTGTIGIEKVYLAYYEGADELDYLLPIFVFEGENGFLGYVEAIK